MGGYDNLEIAKQYYCQAVKLAPSNMRALHGLLLTVTQLASSPKCPQSKKKEFANLAFWSSKQIATRYSAVGRAEEAGDATQDKIALLKSLLGDLDIRD